MIDLPIEKVQVSAYRIPTDGPESDGTLKWDHTTIVLVELVAADINAIGLHLCRPATAKLIQSLLANELLGTNAAAIPARFADMVHAIRNLGRPGICAMAISAVDIALWDLKAKALGQSLASLLGQARDRIEIYGSGGFTSYSEQSFM